MQRRKPLTPILYSFIALWLLTLPAQARAQEAPCGPSAANPEGYIAGPYGVPLRVMDDFGCWTVPIEVYASPKVRIFIPDITKPGWISWHIQQFRDTGVYFTDVYTYHIRSERTARQLLVVNTRTNTVKATVKLGFAGMYSFNLSKATPVQRKTINKITELVEHRFAWYTKHNLPTTKHLANQQRLNAYRMMICSTSPNSPDCTASDAALSPKCLACRNSASRSGINPQSKRESVSNVQAPVVIYTPEPHYTAAARRAKLHGAVDIQCVVGTDGKPHHLKLIGEPLGMGLDQEALKTASEYIFKPALDRNSGKAIPVKMIIEIDFHLY